MARLPPRRAPLFLHGTRDAILPDACSRSLHAQAGEPTRLVLQEGAGHVLDARADEVLDERRRGCARGSCSRERPDPRPAQAKRPRAEESFKRRTPVRHSVCTMAGASKVPENLRYTKDHEWVEIRGDVARIGITDYAQEALTDVVYVELPDVGEEFEEHDSMGVIESVKSVNDVFAPVAGKVVAVNEALDDAPEAMNEDPYGKGWFCELEMRDPAAAGALLEAAAYRKLLESH